MKKFLIVQTASIGDVILTTPIIEKINSFFPGSQIDFLLKKGNEQLLFHHPYIDNIIEWDKDNGKYKNLLDVINLIRSKKYDCLINVQRFASTGILTILSKAIHKVGFDKNPFSIFFSKRIKHKIKVKHGYIHEADRNLKLVEHLTNDEKAPVRLYPSQSDYAKMSQYKTHQYICIAPASIWYTKQYPSERWIDLIRSVNEDLYVYLIGGPGDKELCDNIIEGSGHNNCINFAGSLSYLQTAVLMKDAVMNFSNDSAPQHLASSVNAPVTSVYCSTVPEFGFGPLSDDAQVVETVEKLYCRPCGLHGLKACPEKHFRCAYSINNERLLNRINDKWKKK